MAGEVGGWGWWAGWETNPEPEQKEFSHQNTHHSQNKASHLREDPPPDSRLGKTLSWFNSLCSRRSQFLLRLQRLPKLHMKSQTKQRAGDTTGAQHHTATAPTRGRKWVRMSTGRHWGCRWLRVKEVRTHPSWKPTTSWKVMSVFYFL